MWTQIIYMDCYCCNNCHVYFYLGTKTLICSHSFQTENVKRKEKKMQALPRYSYVGNLNGVCLHTGTFTEFFINIPITKSDINPVINRNLWLCSFNILILLPDFQWAPKTIILSVHYWACLKNNLITINGIIFLNYKDFGVLLFFFFPRKNKQLKFCFIKESSSRNYPRY